jgi:hypothetical protein
LTVSAPPRGSAMMATLAQPRFCSLGIEQGTDTRINVEVSERWALSRRFRSMDPAEISVSGAHASDAATHGAQSQHATRESRSGKPYLRLALMALLSFLAMYLLMYAMVDRPANIFPNRNQAYMAALMAAPMVLIELAIMGKMYPGGTSNRVAIAASVAAFALSFVFIRQQTAIDDQEFLRSMIPHHAGAILMCQEASISDPEVGRLCQTIIASQQAEIDQMKAILHRVD